ncbi:MAG: hypothetical protein MMC33_000429 [Icmadophila ericetorum]|nr:hypothetical protein [Icmadophila ericetorum]
MARGIIPWRVLNGMPIIEDGREGARKKFEALFNAKQPDDDQPDDNASGKDSSSYSPNKEEAEEEAEEKKEDTSKPNDSKEQVLEELLVNLLESTAEPEPDSDDRKYPFLGRGVTLDFSGDLEAPEVRFFGTRKN